jgi:hypothetical protein
MEGPEHPSSAPQAAEVRDANPPPILGIRRFLQLMAPALLPQPSGRDLEAAVAPSAATPPVAAEVPVSFEARLESLRPFLEGVGNALPFLMLLLVQFFSQHVLGILALVWFSLVLHRINETLKAAVAQPTSAHPPTLLVRIGILACNVLLAEFLFASDEVWRCWWRIPLPPVGQALTLPAALWLIVHNQYLLVFTFCAIKTVFICSVCSTWNERRIKECLGFIESICCVWLQLLPVLVWSKYLHDERIGGSVQPFVIIYFSIKLRMCRQHFIRVRSAFTAAVARRCPFGRYMNPSECADRECAICLEGLNVPLKLPCDHIFCEVCLMTWVQREATCPCCRAVVPGADGGTFTNDGSSSLIPQIF